MFQDSSNIACFGSKIPDYRIETKSSDEDEQWRAFSTKFATVYVVVKSILAEETGALIKLS